MGASDANESNGDPMRMMETAQPNESSLLGLLDDEELARESKARMLITAYAPGDAEAVARRIHDASTRAPFPFVAVAAGDLPCAPGILWDTCSTLLEAASGGTLFICDVDQLAAPAQDCLLDVLDEIQRGRPDSMAVRLVSGTTVSLLDRVAAGTFAERLFYRLNVIHLAV